MDEPRTVPAIPTADLETYSQDGSPAWPPAAAAETEVLPQDTAQQPEPLAYSGEGCCAGVDLPGVGITHADDCPVRRHRASAPGMPHVAGVVPPPLRDRLQDELIVSLLFAAKHVAEGNVIYGLRSGERTPMKCRECCYTALFDGTLPHSAACQTGRVLAVLAEMSAQGAAVMSGRDRVSAEMREAVASTISEPVQPDTCTLERVCAECGETGGMWLAEHKSAVLVDLFSLARNQCVGAAPVLGQGHILYTHLCPAAVSEGGAL